MILESLTLDKRTHRILRGFSEKLPAFLEYILDMGEEFILKLNPPPFKGSLLNEPVIDPNDKPSDYRS